ncbi:ABC transporter substrate binding protein [mine drainage metagenome]|uniref:ABC transporter substrate binding protein n=1 Tax=mine drainage metagenome TaxID=410659 RepID=A0A1J5TW73_9ZZZZ
MHRIVFPAVALLLVCISTVQADPLHVTVVLSDEGGAYQTFSDSLRSQLQTDRIALNVQRATQTLGQSDIYVAVGMNATAALSSRDVPTLSVLVPQAGYEQLLKTSVQHGKPHSAVFLDQPLQRQVALLLAALPATRQVGVLYEIPQPELQSLRRLLADKGIHLHDRIVDKTQSLNDALESILNESEVLFVLPDSEVYNGGTIRNILLTAYRKQVPLVGISQAYVKAGALCAVFTTPEQVARQAAGLIERYAESGKLPAPQFPSDFEVSVNKQVARSLEIHIKDADQLRDAIRRAQ